MLKLDLQFFGGRGASSAGGDGRYRDGGISDADIISTTSLISAREREQAAVDEVLQVAQDMFEEYGVSAYDWELAEIDPKAGVLGYHESGGTVAINQAFFGNAKMDTAYADCVASGFHPSNGNKTALQAVTAHEMGHRINGVIASKMGSDMDSVATKIVNDARKSTKHRGVVKMAGNISRYATKNNKETIAEAVADVYCNGKKAKAESIAVVNSMNKYLRGN